MTQKALAKKLHVTDKAVSKWESGLNYLDLSLFPKLAQVLDTTVAELLGLEQSIPNSAIDVISQISKQEKYNLIFWAEALFIGLSLTLITNGIRLIIKYKEFFL